MIKPLGNKILAKEVKPEEKSSGGIIIPTNAQEQPQEAVVLAVGPGKLNDDGTRTPIDINVGDRVAYGKYAPVEFKQGIETYLILSEIDILAVTSEAPDYTSVVIDSSELAAAVSNLENDDQTDAPIVISSIAADTLTEPDGAVYLRLFVKSGGDQLLSKAVPLNEVAKAQAKQAVAV